MPRIEINGLKFHYQQSGSGADVVLVHAFTSNLAVWMFTGIIEALASEFRVTSYDLRGHGNSDVPPSGYTSADMAGDLHALHQRLELQPAWLVGHSFGGVIAMHAAVHYPRMVQGIIFSDTYFPGLAAIEPEMPHAQAWGDLRATLQEVNVEIGPTVDFQRLFTLMADLNAEQLRQLREGLGPASWRWLSQLGKLGNTSAARDAFIDAGLTAETIASVRVPVVGLYDEHSPFMATCRWLEAHLPDCTTDIVPGANHLAPLQSSAAFVGLVQQHLRRMAVAGAARPAGD